MSDDRQFDSNKFKDNLHEQIHREIHERLQARMNRRRPMDARPFPAHWGMFAGGLIAVVGLLILLDNMGFHAVSHLYRFWPLILIAFGVWNLTSRSGRIFGVVLLVIGVLFQLDTLGLANFSWGQIWPLAIIGVGILIIWSSVQARKLSAVFGRSTGQQEGDPRGTLSEVAIFSGIERRINSPDFRGGLITSVFGGVELDLRDAKMAEDQTTIEINAIFGGVEMRIPGDWEVVSRGQAIFGGFVDETKNYRNSTDAPKAKVLLLTGAAVFGSVEIKN